MVPGKAALTSTRYSDERSRRFGTGRGDHHWHVCLRSTGPGRRLWIAYPPGVRRPRRCRSVLLHGYGTDAAGALAAGDYPGYLADAVAAGTPPFALAAASGGNGYWHPHPGDDPLGMVLDEFLPLLEMRGLRWTAPSVLGFSMGGFGALLCG